MKITRTTLITGIAAIGVLAFIGSGTAVAAGGIAVGGRAERGVQRSGGDASVTNTPSTPSSTPGGTLRNPTAPPAPPTAVPPRAVPNQPTRPVPPKVMPGPGAGAVGSDAANYLVVPRSSTLPSKPFIARSREEVVHTLGLTTAPAWLDAFPFATQALVLIEIGPGDGCNNEGVANISVNRAGSVLNVRGDIVSTMMLCEPLPSTPSTTAFLALGVETSVADGVTTVTFSANE